MRPPIEFKPLGNHHSYHGIWMVAFGVFQTVMSLNGGVPEGIPYWLLFIGVGLFMIVDDIVEHTITADTPLRILYEKVIYPFLIRNK